MDLQTRTLLIMAKMALADGAVSEAERDFITPYLPEGKTFDDYLKQAKNLDLAEIVDTDAIYADKFFLALRAACMANVDLEFHQAEKQVYQVLLSLLNLKLEDQRLIESIVDAQETEGEEDVYLSPRFQELYEASGLAQVGN